MPDADHLLASPERCVTASDLVRQFGLWQERALQQPVFVLRRGRPSLVLTSLDLMRRLCAPHDRAAAGPLLDLLLDAMREIAIVADAAGRVVQLNRACRIAFPGAAAGLPLDALMPAGTGRFLTELAERSRRGGAAEQAEVTIAGRQFAFTIVPAGEGALHVAADVTTDAEADGCTARLGAFEDGVDLFDDIAWARINLRGYLEASSATLSRMTAIDPAMLHAVRFVTLVDPASRGAVGEAIESVIADSVPRRLDVRLHGADAAVVPVRLVLAAERVHGRAERIAALVRADVSPNNFLRS